MTNETTAGVEQLLPCRECGRECSVQTFDSPRVQVTLWLCSGHPHLGGGCPSNTAYLSEDAWNTRAEQPRPTEGDPYRMGPPPEGVPSYWPDDNGVLQRTDRPTEVGDTAAYSSGANRPLISHKMPSGKWICWNWQAASWDDFDTDPRSISSTKTTEIRDPILRLFIEEILRQTPNGEAIRVTYRPNGEWSVLPEATGKADVGLVEALEIAELALATVVEGDPMGVPKNTQCRHGRYTFEGCESCTDAVLDPALESVRAALSAREALATGADGGSRQPATHPDSALEQWKLVRGICNNSPMFSDARGWKRVTVELLSALRQPAPRADDALPIARMLGDLLATIHRDGGHRQDEVGTEQAWMEAMMTVPFLLEAKDAALASVEPTAAKGN